MDFSFGVITYNSEKYILETLESIKYQVLMYGNEKKIELIVSDDCSKDSTLDIVYSWMNINKELFENVEVLTVEKNTGTVQNYKRTFHRIKADYFHIIAGDDLYTKNSIFEFAKYLDLYDIVTTVPIGLNDNGELFFHSNRIQRHIYRMNHKPFSCKTLSKMEMFGSFLHSPSTVFKKKLLTDEIEKFVDNFFLYEDDPKYYRMLKCNDNIGFVMYPIIVYRHHLESVCYSGRDFQNITGKSFRADEIKLCEYYISETDNFLLKKYLKSKIKMINKGGKVNFYNICRGVESLYVRFINRLHHIGREYQNELARYKSDFYEYYNNIRNNSKQFYTEKFEDNKLCSNESWR